MRSSWEPESLAASLPLPWHSSGGRSCSSNERSFHARRFRPISSSAIRCMPSSERGFWSRSCESEHHVFAGSVSLRGRTFSGVRGVRLRPVHSSRGARYRAFRDSEITFQRDRTDECSGNCRPSGGRSEMGCRRRDDERRMALLGTARDRSRWKGFDCCPPGRSTRSPGDSSPLRVVLHVRRRLTMGQRLGCARLSRRLSGDRS